MFDKVPGFENFSWMLEGAVTFFRRIFCLTLPKILIGNPWCFKKFLVAKKLYRREKGKSSFSVETFCITVPIFFWELFFVSEKFWHSGGEKLVWRREGDITLIIYYIADLPVTPLRVLTNKSVNIAVLYASLRSRILLTWMGYWTWGVGTVRSSWLVSYAFLYTTSRGRYTIMLNYKFTYIF